MLFVNFEMKAIYIPLPHTGRKYISNILYKYYGFDKIRIEKEDVSEFYLTEDHLVYGLEAFNSEYYSITDKGLVRFVLDEATGGVYNTRITKEIWDSFYKFTFINDPYTRLLRSFNKCHNTLFDESIYFKELFNLEKEKANVDSNFLNNCTIDEFIKRRSGLPNIIINSTFITQTQHLLDLNNNINFQYVGETKYIDRDLITILITIGFTEIKHFKRSNWEKKLNIYHQNDNIYDLLTNENIQMINDVFKEDFETFDFHKYNSVDEIKHLILPDKNTYINCISNLYHDNYVKTYLLYANTQLAKQAETSYKQHRQILKNTLHLDTTNILDKQYNKITEKFFFMHNENSKINDNLHIDTSTFVELYQKEKYTCDICSFLCNSMISLLVHKNHCTIKICPIAS